MASNIILYLLVNSSGLQLKKNGAIFSLPSYTRTREWLCWQGSTAIKMTDPSSLQRERPTSTNPQMSDRNKSLVLSPDELYSKTDFTSSWYSPYWRTRTILRFMLLLLSRSKCPALYASASLPAQNALNWRVPSSGNKAVWSGLHGVISKNLKPHLF
jgi:hypothetical protein